jgi:hypothetical protein
MHYKTIIKILTVVLGILSFKSAKAQDVFMDLTNNQEIELRRNHITEHYQRTDANGKVYNKSRFDFNVLYILNDSNQSKIIKKSLTNLKNELIDKNGLQQKIEQYDRQKYIDFQVTGLNFFAVSYFNNHIFIKLQAKAKCKKPITNSNTDSHANILKSKTYTEVYALDLNSGQILAEADLHEFIVLKQLKKALSKKWAKLYNNFTEEEWNNNTSNYTKGLSINKKIKKVIADFTFEKSTIYWSGAGLMVEMKDKDSKWFSLHLNYNELTPKIIKKGGPFPKFKPLSMDKSIENFRSPMNVSFYWNSHTQFFDLSKIPNPNIKELKISWKQFPHSKETVKATYFYKDGILHKKRKGNEKRGFTIDKIEHTNNLLSKITIGISEKTNRFSKITKINRDKKNNRVSILSLRNDNSTEFRERVFHQNQVLETKYNLFSSNLKNYKIKYYTHIKDNLWEYVKYGNKKAIFVLNEDGTFEYLEESAKLYNQNGQVIQKWNKDDDYLLYTYDDLGRVKEINKLRSSQGIIYRYLYEGDNPLPYQIKEKHPNEKTWRTNFYNWK